MKDGAGILLAGLAGKTRATGPGATGGSWSGESWGENTCRNGTDVVLHEKSKNRYNHGSGCPRFIYESVVEVESNLRTRIKQRSIQKLVAMS